MKRILAVKLADLGDLLTATPALRALRNEYPDAHIGALVTPSSAIILRGTDAVDEIVPFEKSTFDRKRAAARAFPHAARLVQTLRRGRWDCVVLFHHLTTWFGTAKYAALCLASPASVRAGLDNGRGRFLTHRARDQGFGARHEVDYWLSVVETLGAQNHIPRLELTLTDADHAWANQALVRLGRRGPDTVAIHPGSGNFSMARRWPPERFAAVARGLEQRDGLRPVLLHGPAPGEAKLAAEIGRACSSEGAHLGRAPSPQALSAFLRRVRLFIGNDSGVMHLAVAAGTPTVAVFGPSNDRAWGPYPPGAARHAVVRETLACTPCIHRGHTFGTPEGCGARTCLDVIEPARVLAQARQVLDRTAPDESSRGLAPIAP